MNAELRRLRSVMRICTIVIWIGWTYAVVVFTILGTRLYYGIE